MSIPPGGIYQGSMINKSRQRRIVHRLKIARGHLDKVVEMVETGAYCIDVVHQSLAVQAALKSADQAILKNHMETCMEDAIKAGKSKQVIEEMVRVLEKK